MIGILCKPYAFLNPYFPPFPAINTDTLNASSNVVDRIELFVFHSYVAVAGAHVYIV